MVLGVNRSASKSDIKKAYHKSALSSHPDKVPDDERPAAETKFKAVSRAYEILYDNDSRHLYDTHGMAAFEKGGNAGAEPDMDDILNMFGMGGMSGMPGMGGMGGRAPRRPQRGDDEVTEYEITLEELYKGKSAKFNSTKNVICATCKGSGGKERAQAKQCGTCNGQGMARQFRQVGPGLVTPVNVPCSTCNGAGKFFKDKDRCKKCKGQRTYSQKKQLELYIPPGSREGERIVLPGEADQNPDQEPGDIVFVLVEEKHKTFSRAGADLQADLYITLAEALTGFDRVVVTHLDGRGISLKAPQTPGNILRPDQVIKVPGEGMPVKKSDAKGDLYFTVNIEFPEDGSLKDDGSLQKIRELLPGSIPAIKADEVDEVEYESDADLEEFGAGSGDPRSGGQWEDEDGGQPQCQQQ